ncbi:MAG: hypothetical protein AAF125_00835 [Chloroflexota bacterium]
MPQHSDEKLTEVQVKYADMLMNKPNVVGVGIGYAKENGVVTDEKCIVAMVTEKLPEAQLTARDLIPRELDGVRVDVQAFGSFSA